MNARRKLSLKIALSLLLAMLVSFLTIWFVHNFLSECEAKELIKKTCDEAPGKVNDYLNFCLLENAFEARDILAAGYATDSAALNTLAKKLQVTEICVVDKTGKVKYSSNKSLIADGNKEAFNFATAKDGARDLMELITSNTTEMCREFYVGKSDADKRRYAAVHLSGDGFIAVGCNNEILKQRVRASLIYVFQNWSEGGNGGVIITTDDDLVLADYQTPSRTGSQWKGPDDSCYWGKKELNGFCIYTILPKANTYEKRNIMVAITSVLNFSALVFITILVGVVIARFVREQVAIRSARELKTATEIQLAALPNVFPPYPDEMRVDIRASMNTAKEVGGDFYDFYFLEPNHLFFLIADVSGKGVPAALFMMRVKSLIKSTAQRGKSLSDVFKEVNDTLSEGNSSNTFVTAWGGEINLETGLLTYVNAGHNPPIIRRNGKVEYLSTQCGLVLGVLGGVNYSEMQVQLEPNDGIYLYTDGITEQSNPEEDLFGEDRLLKLLEKPYDSQEALLNAITDAVNIYAGSRDQDDDCTQLVVRYRGKPTVALEKTYKPTMDDLTKATAELETALEGVPLATKMKIQVVADEIFANIVRHSGASEWFFKVELTQNPKSVRLTFMDDGKPFDPLSVRDPDTTLSAEKRAAGGVGIFIVKKTMSPIRYVCKNGRNILTMSLTYNEQ